MMNGWKSRNSHANMSSKSARSASPGFIRQPKPKPAWNDNVADPDRFKLTPEEIIKRKQLLISKHNVLSENYKPPKEKSILRKLKVKKDAKKKELLSSSHKKVDSIDLLTHGSENHESYVDFDKEGSESEKCEEDSFDRNLTNNSKHTSSANIDNWKSLIFERKSSGRTLVVQSKESKSKPQPRKAAKNLVVTPDEKIEENELEMISEEIKTLQQELRLYEELSGKKSILDAEELDAVFAVGDDECPVVNQKTVTRYLVQLVCQSMTYLLKAQVDKETLQAEVDLLRAKVTELGDIIETRIHAAASFSQHSQAAIPSPPSVIPTVPMVTPEYSRPENRVSICPTVAIPRVLQVASEMNKQATPSLAQQAMQEMNEKQSMLKAAFRGTSTSDFLFMPGRSPPAVTTPQPHQMYDETMQAAESAVRTFDLYAKGRSEGHDNNTVITGDSYDDMIERLSYKFTTNRKGEGEVEQPQSISPDPRAAESEGFSIVTPNSGGILPLPAQPSQHPFTVASPTYLQHGVKKELFGSSPVVKRVYDATLGNYQLIEGD